VFEAISSRAAVCGTQSDSSSPFRAFFVLER